MRINEPYLIGTTRFNDDTYKENLNWRDKHSHPGCVYAVNKKIADSITPNILIYVLEMNNSKNKIMGIGLIRNNYDKRQKIRVYNSDLNYNRFVYHSNKRIDCKNIKYKKMLSVLETIGYDYAACSIKGKNTKETSNYLLRRSEVVQSDSLSTITNKINGYYDFY